MDGSGTQEFIWNWLKIIFFTGLVIFSFLLMMTGYRLGKASGPTPPDRVWTVPECIEHCHDVNNIRHYDVNSCLCIKE